MILVDTNILIDLREDDPVWQLWSFRAVADARLRGDVAASAITIGELASRSGSLADIAGLCAGFGIRMMPLSVAGAHRAGIAQQAYRIAGGKRDKLLADFMIGGEAEVSGAGLLTRDPKHYRTYFPDLTLITPETDA